MKKLTLKSNFGDGKIVLITVENAVSLPEMPEIYTDFLRGCGFIFDGSLTIEEGE